MSENRLVRADAHDPARHWTLKTGHGGGGCLRGVHVMLADPRLHCDGTPCRLTLRRHCTAHLPCLDRGLDELPRVDHEVPDLDPVSPEMRTKVALRTVDAVVQDDVHPTFTTGVGSRSEGGRNSGSEDRV